MLMMKMMLLMMATTKTAKKKIQDDVSSAKVHDLDTLRSPFDDIEVYVRNAKGPLSREYLRLLFTDTKKRIDNVYGVYLGSDKDLMIGDSVLNH